MTFNFLCKSAIKYRLSSCQRPHFVFMFTRNIRGRGPHSKTTLGGPKIHDYLDVEDGGGEDLDLSDAVGSSNRREWEEFLTSVDMRDPEVMQDLKRFEKNERSKLKRKILAKKYFKKKPEVSVLTWQAKEQIRYLNQEYPEEWTIDKLIESFPVSRDGVLSILRSSYIPRDEKEIRKHDNKAFRNIQNLKEQIGSNAMDSDEKNEMEEKLKKIGNASGIKSLPLTEFVTRRSIAAQSKFLRPSNKIGPFKSMLMYVDSVVEGEIPTNNQKYAILPENNDMENLQINNEKSNYEIKQLESSHHQTPVNLQKSNMNRSYDLDKYDRRGEDRLSPRQGNERFDNSSNMQSKSRFLTQTKSEISIRKDKRNQHELYRQKDSRNNMKSRNLDLKKMQDENIQDIVTERKSIKKWNTEPEIYGTDTFEKIITTRKPYVELSEKHPHSGHGEVENDIFKPIEVPRRRNATFYKKGNVMYDEEGEFLYKIP